MRRRPAAILAAASLALSLLAPAAIAHIGSPDTWFEGPAGRWPLRVVVRAPGVVPGLAQIDVRVLAGHPSRVTVQPFVWNAGPEGAPPADEAHAVRGDAQLYSVQLWFMRASSYAVHVVVEGDRGAGTAIVPVQAVATRRLPMDRALVWILIALGLFLAAGLVTFVGAALRESVLEPGLPLDARHVVRGRIAAIVTAAVLALALTGGRRWWDAVDREYRSQLDRPLHLTASVATAPQGPVLQLALDDPEWLGRRWTPLIADHGKLMHLFLVREGRLDAMAHLHPLMRDTSHFDVRLPALPPGRYRVYADVVHESGYTRTLAGTVAIGAGGAPTPQGDAPEADPDDSWFQGAPQPAPADGPQRFTFADGTTILLDAPARLVARRDQPLRFVVRHQDGSPALLEPYLGMPAHAIVMREDGAVFAHLHPVGSISMASQMALAMRTPADSLPGSLARRMSAMGGMSGHMMPPADEPSGRFEIPYGFPSPGRYRIWVQVRVGGVVRTAPFAVEVVEAGAA